MSSTPNNEHPPASLYHWIIAHDDSWVFVALYIGLAVVLSAAISLFWLVIVVGVHFAFELIRQRHLLGRHGPMLAEALWELRLDAALIIFAMAVALYMDFVIGVAGLRLAPRLGRVVSMGARGGTRVAAWSRVLRGVLLSVDDVAQFLRAVLFRKRRAAQNASDAANESSIPKNCRKSAAAASKTPIQPKAPLGRWAMPWRTGDWLIAGFFAVSVLLVVLAPVLTDHTAGDALSVMLMELHPFPSR